MADNTILNAGAGGDTIASDDIAGIKHQRVKVEFGADGVAADVSAANPLPITSKTALTASAPAVASVGVASAVAVAAAATRKGLILTNTSQETISLAFDAAAAVLGSGITLFPGGIFKMDEHTFSTAAINAIASAAASTLAVQEFTT